MQPIDGQDANMLQYYKDKNIPHTYQCSKCGTFMGVEPPNRPDCVHRWVMRDLTPFKNGTQNEAENPNPSI